MNRFIHFQRWFKKFLYEFSNSGFFKRYSNTLKILLRCLCFFFFLCEYHRACERCPSHSCRWFVRFLALNLTFIPIRFLCRSIQLHREESECEKRINNCTATTRERYDFGWNKYQVLVNAARWVKMTWEGTGYEAESELRGGERGTPHFKSVMCRMNNQYCHCHGTEEPEVLLGERPVGHVVTFRCSLYCIYHEDCKRKLYN